MPDGCERCRERDWPGSRVPGAVVETMVDQLDAAVGPVVDKRRNVAKKSDGKDVRLAFFAAFFRWLLKLSCTELFLRMSLARYTALNWFPQRSNQRKTLLSRRISLAKSEDCSLSQSEKFPPHPRRTF